MEKTNLISKLSLSIFVIGVLVLILGLFPFTDNFIVHSKTYFLLAFAGVVGLLFALRSFSKEAVSFLWTPLSLPILLFGSSMLASSLLTSSYPQESLLGMGGVFIAGSIIALLGGVILPKNTGSVLLKTLAISGVLLTASTALQLLGFGPSKLFEPMLGLALPHTVIFNLTGSSLVALQLLVVSVISLVVITMQSKHISKFTAVVLPILLIGVALHLWSILPGKPAAVSFPSFKASWSIALDTIREPRTALIGVGPAAYSNVYLRFKPLWVNATPNWNLQFSQATNAPLYLLTVGGFIGMLSWLFLLGRMAGAYKQSRSESRVVIVAALVCALMQLFLPVNVLITGLQFLLLAAFLASESDRHTLFNLKAPSLSLTSEQGQATQTSKAVAPIYIVTLVFVVGFGALLFFVGKGYAAEIALHQGTLAAQNNDGIGVYNNHQRAVTINPYLDGFRRQYALTNMLLAAALSNKTDATEAEKAQVGELMQQAVREARSATTLDPTDAQNWAVLSQIYQNMIGIAEQAEEFTIQSYIATIENDPTNPALRVSLGGIFLSQEEFAQAATLFQQATEVKPDFANAHYNLAVALVQLNQLERARAAYQQTLALIDPASEDFTTLTAEIEKLEEAISEQAAAASASAGQTTAPSIIDQNVTQTGQSLVEPTDGDVQFPSDAELVPAQ
ncbi:MAG: tetratricopeptide repeat protein [bacterium]|nr:tetratricopeptide repeat protein [bacterium]